MRYIDASSQDGRYIKISDDVTYQEIGVYCDSADQANDIVIRLVVELLKGA